MYVASKRKFVMYVVKSLALDEIRPDHGFINECNPHLTNRFCKVELSPTEFLRWYLSLSKTRWATSYLTF